MSRAAQTPDLSELTDPVMQQGYLKAGFLGFAKGGKTLTAALLAVAVRRQFGIDEPIAMYDTEGGSLYIGGHVKKLTGKDLLAKRDKSFDGMLRWGNAVVKNNIRIGIVDSITHPWRELCDTFLENKQKFFRSKGWSVPQRLQFEDWNSIKPKWQEWTDFYLNSPVHLIICGRAGWEYEMQTSESNPSKKELVKTGIKMKSESEFGFEPSLLVEMERDQDIDGDIHKIVRRAIVLGDRFSVIDGKAAVFPSTEDMEKALKVVHGFFKPHLDCLTPGSHAPISGNKSNVGDNVGEDGDDAGWRSEKRQRQIFCEEIQGELTKAWPSQSNADKQAKIDIIDRFFNTKSWTKVEGLDSGTLQKGLRGIREELAKAKNAAAMTAQPPDAGGNGPADAPAPVANGAGTNQAPPAAVGPGDPPAAAGAPETELPLCPTEVSDIVDTARKAGWNEAQWTKVLKECKVRQVGSLSRAQAKKILEDCQAALNALGASERLPENPEAKPEKPKQRDWVKEWQEHAQNAAVKDLNTDLDELKKLPKNVQAQAWAVVQAEMEIRGFTWDQEKKAFVEAA